MQITSIPKIDYPIQNTLKRVCVYARVSTQMLEQKQSIDKQIEVYTKQINKNDKEVLAGVYLDYGKSGTSIKNRTGFNQMIQDCKLGLINHIITKSISRFARNTLDTLRITKELKEMGVTIYFEKENIDTSSTYSDLLLSIYASFAEEESRSISKNVTWGMRKWLAKGNTKIPYKAFLGYDFGFVINEKQAEVVKKIYQLFIGGCTISLIKKYLEHNQIKTPTNQIRWHYSVIKSILTNEKYIGDVYSQKTFKTDVLDKKRKINNHSVDSYYVKNHHDPIISKVDFNLAQIKIMQSDFKMYIKIRDRLESILNDVEYETFISSNILQLDNDDKTTIITKLINYINRK